MENIATALSYLLPHFELRTLFLLTILSWLLIFLLFNKVFKKITYKIILPITLLLYLASIATLVYFFKVNFTQEIYIPLGISITFFLLQILIFVFSLLKKQPIKKILTLTTVILTTLSILFILIVSLFTKPEIHTEDLNTQLETAKEILLDFTVPVKKDAINIHISPEGNVKYQYRSFLGLESWVTQVIVIPEQSYLPEQKVVIYTTGISRIFPNGIKHEQSVEFTTPKAPEIQELVLGESTTNVPIETEIVANLDTIDQEFILWNAIFDPIVEYEIVRDNTNRFVIKPLNLKQGTEYTLKIFKTIIQFDTETKAETRREAEELIETITFTTVKAPGIESTNRDGNIIANDEPFIINFEQPLDKESLKDKVLITPEIEGDITLSEDNKQLIFTPKTSFKLSTEYTLTVKAGVKNSLGGYIEQDLKATFSTPGLVGINATYPGNGATGLSVGLDYLYVTFNQPVDHSSAQSKFSISPNVDGTFSWKGDTMYYSFKSGLSYGTKYTYTLASGIKAVYGANSTSAYTKSFTTKDQTILLNVPLYYQQESFTCNIAATRMVLGYKGISSSEEQIKSSVGIGGDPNSDWVDMYGVHWGPISSYISSRGVSNTIKRGWNLTAALEEVKNGHPTLLYMYNGYTEPKGPFTLESGETGYKGMHSEILVGFVGTPSSPKQVIVLDPWRGKRYMSVSAFNGYWSYLNNTGIVIY